VLPRENHYTDAVPRVLVSYLADDFHVARSITGSHLHPFVPVSPAPKPYHGADVPGATDR
jgi:hypothetical protein